MRRPNIIGLCGSIGAGKDTVAAYLAEAHGYQVLSFAAKLKDVVVDVYGLEDRHVFGSQADKAEPLAHVLDATGRPRTSRQLLEIVGTEGFRAASPNTWVDYLMRKVDREPASRYAIADVRFPNEAEAVRARGGVVWEVVKVGGPDHGRTGHVSDAAWRDMPKDDHIIARHGDLDALRLAVDLALEGRRATP